MTKTSGDHKNGAGRDRPHSRRYKHYGDAYRIVRLFAVYQCPYFSRLRGGRVSEKPDLSNKGSDACTQGRAPKKILGHLSTPKLQLSDRTRR